MTPSKNIYPKPYAKVVAAMQKLGCDDSQMFGMPTLKFEGKALCGLFDDKGMVFKLTGEDHAAALKLKGAKLFDPMGGRPMKEWVQIPLAHSATWFRFAQDSFQYVVASPKKKK